MALPEYLRMQAPLSFLNGAQLYLCNSPSNPSRLFSHHTSQTTLSSLFIFLHHALATLVQLQSSVVGTHRHFSENALKENSGVGAKVKAVLLILLKTQRIQVYSATPVEADQGKMYTLIC